MEKTRSKVSDIFHKVDKDGSGEMTPGWNIIFVAVRGGVGDGSCALNLSNAKNAFAYFVLVSKCVRWNLQAVWLGPPLLTPNELHPITVSV